MLQYESATEILDLFPVLNKADIALREEFAEVATIHSFPSKEVLYREGDACNFLALVTAGKVRVHKIGGNGREITLYNVGRGECCFLTASCVMRHSPFPAIAEVEEDVEAVLVPSVIIHDWIKKYEIWTEYLFSLLTNRLSNVTLVLNQIAFERIDKRIAELLIKEQKENVVSMTHQEIALIIGSAREVVSRILKEFEKEGIVELQRGKTIIRNVSMLLIKISKF